MTGRLIQRKHLSPAQRSEMFELLHRHFEGVEPDQFGADLSEKNWVILLEDEAGRIKGFSTLWLHPTTFEDEDLTLVCSGDTIVDPAAWKRE